MCIAVVELAGIEPASSTGSLRFLRAQSMEAFYSAPIFSTDT